MSRNWCFTLNNYLDIDIDSFKKYDTKYIVFGKEVGDSGTPHLQGYMEFKGVKRLDTLHNAFPRAHFEMRKGTAKQASEYCKKDGDYFEKGVMSKQGARTDLADLVSEVKNGKKVDDIALEDPVTYHQYGRTLSKVEDIVLRSKYRNWMTTCEWLYGETGTGKSHKAFEKYDPKTCYVWKLNDKGWQDGYTGQEIVIINDLRGEITYNDLLNLIDRYPYSLPRRGREPVPFLAKHIIITSSLHPKDIYRHRESEDKLEQLLRRVTVNFLCQKWSGNTALTTKKSEKNIKPKK